MIRKCNILVILIPLLMVLKTLGFGQGNDKMNGKWIIIPEKSSGIGLYRTLSIDIQHSGNLVNIIQTWGPKNRRFIDTLTLLTSGEANKLQVKDRVFPTNVFMGLSMIEGEDRTIQARWEENGNM